MCQQWAGCGPVSALAPGPIAAAALGSAPAQGRRPDHAAHSAGREPALSRAAVALPKEFRSPEKERGSNQLSDAFVCFFKGGLSYGERKGLNKRMV